MKAAWSEPLMTNFGAELAFAELNIPFERANVGDRYVMEKLNAFGWTLGGERFGTHCVQRKYHDRGRDYLGTAKCLLL